MRVARRNRKMFRKFLAISPEGIIYNEYNLSKFCIKHNLDDGHMGKVARNITTQHKGWICSYIDD